MYEYLFARVRTALALREHIPQVRNERDMGTVIVILVLIRYVRETGAQREMRNLIVWQVGARARCPADFPTAGEIPHQRVTNTLAVLH